MINLLLVVKIEHRFLSFYELPQCTSKSRRSGFLLACLCLEYVFEADDGTSQWPLGGPPWSAASTRTPLCRSKSVVARPSSAN